MGERMMGGDPLREILRRWGQRVRLSESLIWGPWGASVGLAVGLALALAARMRPLLIARHLIGAAGLLALIGALIGAAAAWLRPRPLSSLARLFDRRFGLAERLTTAVEIADGRLHASPAMAAAQQADALQAARRAPPLPLRAPRWALVAVIGLAAALALAIGLPNPQEDVLAQQAAVQAAIEEQIEALEEVREEIAAAEGLSEADRQALLQALDETIAALEEGRLTPEEAVAALSEAEQTLARLQDPEAARAADALREAAEALSDSEWARDVAEALAAEDYEAAAEALAEYGGERLESLTPEERQELARELAEAAERLAKSNPELAEALAQAAEALSREELGQAQEAILQAAQLMKETGEEIKRQEAMAAALAQLQEAREKIASLGQGGEQGGQAGMLPVTGLPVQPGHHEDSGSGAPYDEDYVPERIEEGGVGVDVGREGEGGAPIGYVALPTSEGGRSNVPYQEVYADYAAQAGVALESSYIPLGMKQYVRDYFSALEP